MIQKQTCGRRWGRHLSNANNSNTVKRINVVLFSHEFYQHSPSLQVQLLHMLHENGGLVSLDGRLFVTGGHWKGMEGDYGVEVEVYNRASNTWEVDTFLPRLWFYSGVCTIFLDPSQWSEVFPVEST